jgi:hypothetical protein
MVNGVILLFSYLSSLSYLSIFGSDYTKAVKFNRDHDAVFTAVAKLYDVDVKTMKAVVFPELIRYSLFSDLLETEALEQLYVNDLADVDFSIGSFQMKPSFAEQVEKYVTDHNLPGFGVITTYTTSNKRKERTARLKSTGWQLAYLCCFIKITEHRFPSIASAPENERVKLISTAYNSGFMSSEKQLQQRLTEKSFPYGPRMQGQQYNYADIALDYYLTILKKEKP